MGAPTEIAGRYIIGELLGKGAGGETYKARDQNHDAQLVAIKLLPTQEAADEIRNAFLKECRLLQRIDHPLIARLLDSGSDQDFLYYVSEYVEGGDIVSEAQTRDWNAVFALIVQAAWALQHLHDCGVIHGDLKPDNLLVGKIHRRETVKLEERSTLKIIDFGLANIITGKERGMKGSLAYMAPEMLAGSNYDHRADLYSFGLVLYEIAWGKLPQAPQKSFAKYLETLRTQAIDLSPLQEGGIPNGAIKLIESLTQKDPGARLLRADAIIKLLNQTESENFPIRYTEEDIWRELPSLEVEAVTRSVNKSLSSEEALAQLQELSRGGDREAAWQLAEHYLEEIEDWKDAATVEAFYASAIHTLIEQGRFVEATALIKKMGAKSLEASLLGAQLEYRRGDYKKAKQKLDAASLAKATPDQKTRYESARAFLFQAQKKWGDAAAAFENAAAYAAASGRRDHQASLLANAGGLYTEQIQWQKGYELLQEALKLAHELKNPSLIARVAHNLGNLYLSFGRWAEASDKLLESLEQAKALGMKPLAIANLCLLTRCEEGRGNRERVMLYLDQGLALAEELAETQALRQCFLAKGYAELAQENWEAVRQSVKELLQRSESDPYYQLQARWLAAKCDIATEKISNDTQACLDEVEQDARQRGALLSLWQVLADRGHYQEALEILETLGERVPVEFKESFWRDRKKERIRKALESGSDDSESPPVKQANDFQFARDSPKEAPMETTQTLTFQKWNAIHRRLLQQRKLDTLLDEMLDAAIDLTDAERGFIIHSETQDINVKSARNYSREDLEGEDGQFSQTIANEVLRKGETIVLLDATKDERFSVAASVHKLGIRSVFCVPLKAGTRPIGLIYLDNRIRPGVFEEDQVPLLEELADQASLVLEHMCLHLENRERIVELEKARATIERLNAELQKDLQSTSDSLEAARENLRRQNEETALRYSYDHIIGRSPAILEVLRRIDRIVDTDMNIFIYGESGTGKELIARALHFNSPRKENTFVAENCAAIPENLLESELFGHVRGAFTGADQDRVGLFELADGGTLFLDEIGEMPLSMQAKLLRVLQEQEVRRLGGKEYKKINVRVVSASNKDLKALVSAGKFRQDLFYRLHVARIHLPPLRKRPSDIPLLIDHFLEKAAQESESAKKKISSEALKILADYDWPGNVRELENEITRASLLGTELKAELLSPHLVERVYELRGSPLSHGLETLVAEVEKKAIAEAMEKTGGNKVKTAKLLQISRRTLYVKLELYGIKKKAAASTK